MRRISAKNVSLSAKTGAESETGRELVSLGFSVRTAIHKRHLKTKSYARHKALNEYYDELLDLIDEFAETLLGRYPDVEFDEIQEPQGAATDIITAFRKHLDDNRPSFTSSELLNILDDIQILNSRTLYLLTLS